MKPSMLEGTLNTMAVATGIAFLGILTLVAALVAWHYLETTYHYVRLRWFR